MGSLDGAVMIYCIPNTIFTTSNSVYSIMDLRTMIENNISMVCLYNEDFGSVNAKFFYQTDYVHFANLKSFKEFIKEFILMKVSNSNIPEGFTKDMLFLSDYMYMSANTELAHNITFTKNFYYTFLYSGSGIAMTDFTKNNSEFFSSHRNLITFLNNP